MRFAKSTARSAFSLLEMILALALGMVLLLALYLFLSTSLFHSQAGRDVLAEGTIVRNIMSKINSDISGQLGPVDTRVADYPAANPATPSTTTPAANISSLVSFNTGVYGQPKFLILSNYRVQKPNPNNPTNVPDPEVNSDLRRTVYWLVGNGASTVGLARAEFRQATSTDVDTIDPTLFPDQNKYVFAPEVKDITFQYWNGSAYQDTWDGTLVEADGTPPTGPPLAIQIKITLKSTLSQTLPADSAIADGPTYMQIFAIPTSNGFAPKPAVTP